MVIGEVGLGEDKTGRHIKREGEAGLGGVERKCYIRQRITIRQEGEDRVVIR